MHNSMEHDFFLNEKGHLVPELRSQSLVLGHDALQLVHDLSASSKRLTANAGKCDDLFAAKNLQIYENFNC